MPHREIQEIISAMADRQELTPGQLERVRDHCRHCPECAAFATAVAQLRGVKAPRSPRGLAARIVTTVAAEMDADRAAREALAALAVDATETGVEGTDGAPETASDTAPPTEEKVGWRELDIAWLSRERLWTIMASVGASAALVLIAFFVAGRMNAQTTIAEETGKAVSESVRKEQYGSPGAPTGGASTQEAATPASSAPPFVVFSGMVYAPGDPTQDVDPSRLTTAGIVTSALSASGPPVSRTVYTRPSDRGIVVKGDDDEHVVCTPVTRRYHDAVYQLASGVPITQYGSWPRLPAEMAEPSNASGSPTFISAGRDSTGITVYARLGTDTDSGIAVAPGTKQDDPAHGNPYWTWWVPVKAE